MRPSGAPRKSVATAALRADSPASGPHRVLGPTIPVTTIATSQPLSNARPASVGLYRFAVFFAVFVLLHIKGGALVTSTGSGMAFTDWPLARGSLWPPGMDLEDLFEHVHRVSGSLVGLLAIALAVWIRRADPRRWLGALGFVLLGLVVVQGVLGGLGVLYGEEGGATWAPAAIGHGVLAQPTLCLAVFVAFALSRAWHERIVVAPAQALTARKLTAAALVLVFAQLFVGAVVRHTDHRSMLWLHVGMALFVSLVILIASAYTTGRLGAGSPGLRRLGVWLFVVLLAQIALGFLTLALRRFKDPSNIEYLGRSAIVSSHVVTGAVLFLLATLLLARAWRNLVTEADGAVR